MIFHILDRICRNFLTGFTGFTGDYRIGGCAFFWVFPLVFLLSMNRAVFLRCEWLILLSCLCYVLKSPVNPENPVILSD